MHSPAPTNYAVSSRSGAGHQVEQRGHRLPLRLVHKPSGKPVADAAIVQTRLDMAPDGMADMAHGDHSAAQPRAWRSTAFRRPPHDGGTLAS